MKHWIEISLILWYSLWILPPNPTLAEGSSSWKGFGDKLPISGFTVNWLDDKTTFQAGDIATIKIKPLGYSFSDMNLKHEKYAMNFSISVSGKKGNSSYVSGVIPNFDGDPTCWNISFTPILVGDFTVVITEDHTGITDSSLHFNVTAGRRYPSACMASWMNLINEFVAGTKAYVLVLPKDAFGNNISAVFDGPNEFNFTASAHYENGSIADVLAVRFNGWNELGYIGMEFVPATAGILFLHVYGDSQTLNGSPLPFTVKPGPLDITKCVGKWKYDSNSLQIFSKLEICIYQQDVFGNLVPGLYPFDVRVVQKATNLSVPIADFSFQEVALGIQMLSFIVSEPGDFMLTIFSATLNESISNVPYDYTVFTGYCHGLNSVVNGSGLTGSVAGRMSYFTVYLEDMYHNPSPVEEERLHVQILSVNGTFNVPPVIFPLRNFDERSPVGGHFYPAKGRLGTVSALPGNQNSTSVVKSRAQTSAFNVAYTPAKSGDYEIWVFCGNIPLNDGRSFLMKVSPGMVDTSLSSVLKFVPRVKRLVKNEVVVQLIDSLSNPTPSHQTKLGFKTATANSSGFLNWTFVDKEDGSYVGYYLVRDLGVYNICISFEDKNLSPCPFEINVYKREYFPEAYNDSISVWEDESAAFDVLCNDYVPAGRASIVESSIPLHGSLLQYGQMFRYTPYKGFFGNDSFFYTISDINKNIAMGTAIISVLCKPPQFVSVPVGLHVTEDVISPKFGGFPGFEIKYSDITENISITIRTQSGNILLAPTPMQLWQPLGSRLSVSTGGKKGKDLILAGHVEVINSALQLIQYLGNENFYGNDIITLYAMNKNGIQDAHVPVFVEPTNDPPFINAPKFIALERKERSDSLQIFDKQRDVFEFSIADADLLNFPGNKSQFLVTFSMEVDNGILVTSLPVYLTNTAELKLKNSNQWQPLQTFVTISNHFVLKGRGVRFRATIGDCNIAMQRLLYQGVDHGAILTITVNDMGNYGCYPDCTDMMSLPLFTEVTVSLIKRRPISSMTAFLLGSVIILEFIMMLLLGGILLFFICKCTNALHKERKRESVNDIKLSKVENLDNPTMIVEPSKNMTYFTGCSSPISLRNQHSNFRQRSRRVSKQEDSGKDELPSSSQFSSDRQNNISNCFAPLSIEKGKRREPA